MVIKLLDIYFPVDFVLWAVFNCDWKISSIVEKSEFTYWNLSAIDSTSSWLKRNWLWFSLVQTEALSTESITLLKDLSASSSNRYLLLINWFDFCNCTTLLLQIFLREITKSWVLSSWKIFVVVWFPLLSRSHWQAFLQVIFQNHLSSWSYSSDSVGWLHWCHFSF